MRSVRRAAFKRMLAALPPEVQRQAHEAFRLFLQDPFHPSFHRRIVEKTRHWEHSHWEFRLTRTYRATCVVDGDTYVWVFIGHHRDFDRFYS